MGAEMGNHLSGESSPYLLQHKDNPVDWYPWGAEAFARAKREDKPVFLSVGYSTCHWCHVMARESFENKEIADILNQYYISVKVDREERPDIDSVYMSVCQAATGSGGWPMSVFLTPEQLPFYAGTYFPPESRYGMVGFKELLLRIAEIWRTQKRELLESSENILARLDGQSGGDENAERGAAGRSTEKGASGRMSGRSASEEDRLLRLAAEQFSGSFDRTYGGFGSAPKFPAPHNLLFLMLYARLEGQDTLAMAERTLVQMRRGGIFDQIGYGFSRYSTDRRYLAPHFEKMLYDNALLVLSYAVMYRLTKNALYLDTAEQTADYVFRELTSEEGGFFSAQDADSEGREGRFYVFDREEVLRVLGHERGALFCAHYDITGQGNFEGKSIPNLLQGNEISDAFEQERQMLLSYRKKRAALHLDDKILTAWNALMICALSVLCRVSKKPRCLEAAERACRFIEEKLCDGSRLYVSWRQSRSVPGFLDDYAYYAAALIGLYDATGEEAYLSRAKILCGEARRQFADEDGGYFLCGRDNDPLIFRPKETYDGALPSGNAVMAYNLVRLFQITGEEAYRTDADRQLAFLAREAAGYPAGHTAFLLALLCERHPPMRITVVSDGTGSRESILSELPLLAQVRILDGEEDGYRLLNEKTTYYVCSGHTCLPPTNEAPQTMAAERGGA